MGEAHTSVREVRGIGYFYAVDLCADSATDRDLSPTQEAALQGGVGAQSRQERPRGRQERPRSPRRDAKKAPEVPNA